MKGDGQLEALERTLSSIHKRYGDGAITENGKEIREDQYLTFAIRDKAIEFIRDHREEPFFLYCTFSAPHIPFQAPIDYYCQYSHIEDDNKRIYYAMISALVLNRMVQTQSVPAQEIEALYVGLTDRIKKTDVGTGIRGNLDAVLRTAIGSRAPVLISP